MMTDDSVCLERIFKVVRRDYKMNERLVDEDYCMSTVYIYVCILS